MKIELPDFCLVLLVGAAGSGKSRLANRLFSPDEILSSDHFRYLVSGDESDPAATGDAFDCLYHLAQKRLDRRKLTLVDATNLKKWARTRALEFAKKNHCFCYALALDIPEEVCQQNNAARDKKRVPKNVVKRQCEETRRALTSLRKENFRRVFVLKSLEEADNLEITRVPLWTDKSDLVGPFDVIGDVHGCYEELCALLKKLGYAVDANNFNATPPPGRTAVFLGDLCDRGPANLAVLKTVMNMSASGAALCVPGNHEDKLSRRLEGRKTQINNGLELTLAELDNETPAFKKSVREFLRGLVSHYLLDGGKFVVAHAGLPAPLQGRSSAYVREFCLYGNPTGNMDEFGLPERADWAADYNGSALVAYGHSPVAKAKIVNNTICLDTGCVFGGALAALRYPEMEIVSVPAQKIWFASPKPLQKPANTYLPDVSELLKRKKLETGLDVTVFREEERSLGALEIAGRFAITPNWLIYLPPAMSPCETSDSPRLLEHPREAFAYYKNRGVKKVICEEKHVGSRAIVIVCANEQAAQKRFAAKNGEIGVIYTRTGRPFFTGEQTETGRSLLAKIQAALSASAFWRDFETDWVCLDCELMPWSYKAEALIASQYAPYGVAGANYLAKALEALTGFGAAANLAAEEKETFAALRARLGQNHEALAKYNRVWRSYRGEVNGVEDIKLAPFHILATARKVWSDVPHDRHLALIKRYLGDACAPTRNKIVNLENPADIETGREFWKNLLADGAEGMVVKPLDFVRRTNARLSQPALKCRGPEYLRIIYGADYPDHIETHKKRNLAPKRKRALKEFALGLEALELFVRGEPLRKIHELVFTILALESEPQDMRL